MSLRHRWQRATFLATIFVFTTGCDHDAPSGAELAQERGCIACHGISGKATAPIYPNLQGQWERYLRLQLRAYRDGRRENTIMQGMAATLTDEEIRALAAHFGR